MRMGQELKTGLGHGGISCVLQTQFSSYLVLKQLNVRIFFPHIWLKSIKWLLRYCQFHVLCYF